MAYVRLPSRIFCRFAPLGSMLPPPNFKIIFPEMQVN